MVSSSFLSSTSIVCWRGSSIVSQLETAGAALPRPNKWPVYFFKALFFSHHGLQWTVRIERISFVQYLTIYDVYLSFLLLHWNTAGPNRDSLHPVWNQLNWAFCLDDNLFFKLSILIGRGACLKGCTFGSILIWLSNTESIYNKIESYDFLYPIISIQILSFAQKMKI